MIKKIKITLSLFCLIQSYAMAGNLAIVLDDVGYRENDHQVFKYPKEISIAIIPDAPFADVRHEQAKAQGRDVLIHLPMEALNHQKIETHHISMGMTQEEIDHLLTFSQQKLPAAIGLNNHMGSKITSDDAMMAKLMKSLKRHQLHFLDSRTTHKSVAKVVGKKYNVQVKERHIFLDSEDNLENVQNQWNKAIQYARKHGTAVVIGHPRHHTLAVLNRELPRLPKDITLIPMHQLWQQEKQQRKNLPFNTLFYGKSFRPIF